MIPASAAGKGGKLMMRLHLTAATAADTVKIKAPAAGIGGFRSGLGDLTYTCAGGAAEVLLGPIETSRFLRMNTVTDKGKIYIDYAGATIAGTVWVYLMP